MPSLWLSSGAHWLGEPGRCTMERVSELAGEQLTDHPKSAHPILAGLCRAANDALPQSARQLLAVLIEPLASSAGLRLRREDLARVATALKAVEHRPRADTAAVFVSTIQLALANGTREASAQEKQPQRGSAQAGAAATVEPRSVAEKPVQDMGVQQAQRALLSPETVLGVHRVLSALDHLSAKSRPAGKAPSRLLEVAGADQQLEIKLEEEPQYARAYCR